MGKSSKVVTHTEGPLGLDLDGRTVMVESTGEALTLSAYRPAEDDDGPDGRAADANGRRLVALWNACRGIATADLSQAADAADDFDRLLYLVHSVQRAMDRARTS